MTFTRVAKLLALLMVAVALWRARPPAAPAHVVVVALPGTSVDLVSSLPGASWTGDIGMEAKATGAVFWRRLLSLEDDIPADSGDVETLWSGSSAPVRAMAVPSRLFGSREQVLAAESAFLGSSTGVVVDASEITSGRLPAPYDRAADAIAAAAATLRRDDWSDWIEVQAAPVSNDVPPAGVGRFQFTRVSDSSYFFSPAYLNGTATLVASPFLRGLERDLRPSAAAHAIALSRRRLDALPAAFSKPDDARPVVVFDTVAEDVTSIFAPDSVPSVSADQVRDAVLAKIAEARAAAGADGLVLVIGGPSSLRDAGTKAWCRLFDGASAKPAAADGQAVAFESARALVRYVTGVSLASKEKPLLPAQIATRHPLRPTVAEAEAASPPPAPGRDWSVATLESLPGAVSRGH